MNRSRIAALIGLILLAAPLVVGTAEAAVIVPPGNPMVGGSVACHLGVQTLRWWVSVTDHSGTVSAYASTGQILHEGTGSFVVVGPKSVTLTEDNKLKINTLKSSAVVDVPDASLCAVVTTTTVPVTTTTLPITTTTVPATTTTTKPVVATTTPSTAPPATHVIVPPPTPPAAVPAAHVAQAQPTTTQPPTEPAGSLAETGSDTPLELGAVAVLLALGLALVAGAARRGRRTAK